MRIKKKWMMTAAAVALAGTLAVGGSLAWFTDSATATNVVTTGNVTIAWQENGKELGKGEGLTFGKDTPVAPGDELQKEANVKNTGSNPALIRAKLSLGEGVDAELVEMVMAESSNWQDGGDGYYYYVGIVEPGSATDDLLKALKISTSADNESLGNKELDVDLVAEAIQSANLIDASNVTLETVKAAFATANGETPVNPEDPTKPEEPEEQGIGFADSTIDADAETVTVVLDKSVSSSQKSTLRVVVVPEGQSFDKGNPYQYTTVAQIYAEEIEAGEHVLDVRDGVSLKAGDQIYMFLYDHTNGLSGGAEKYYAGPIEVVGGVVEPEASVDILAGDVTLEAGAESISLKVAEEDLEGVSTITGGKKGVWSDKAYSVVVYKTTAENARSASVGAGDYGFVAYKATILYQLTDNYIPAEDEIQLSSPLESGDYVYVKVVDRTQGGTWSKSKTYGPYIVE